MTGDWLNVDAWFCTFSAPCVKKRARGLVYPIFFGVCQNTWFCMLGVCSAEVEWVDVVLKT